MPGFRSTPLNFQMIKFLDLKKVNAAHGEEIEAAMSRVLQSGWYLQGEENERFEDEYARYIGTRHAVGVANGLDALILIFRALIETGRLKKGDEVIVPANTYIATILAITETGLVPKLVEPDPVTLEIDSERIEESITPRTRAIMIVHLYGRNAWTERIDEICSKYGLLLLEDNAQAHGCRTADGRRTGSLGVAAAHSFYPGKNLGAMGDGGAVTTNDPELARTVRILANYGSERKYVFKYCGHNSRLDELQAAVLRVKLRYLDEDNDRRRRIAGMYYDLISNKDVTLPPTPDMSQNVFHIFPVLCGHRDELAQYLGAREIQTLIHYPIPPHRQECYREWQGLSLPVTEMIHERELSLPMSPVMTEEEAREVADAVNAFPYFGR